MLFSLGSDVMCILRRATVRATVCFAIFMKQSFFKPKETVGSVHTLRAKRGVPSPIVGRDYEQQQRQQVVTVSAHLAHELHVEFEPLQVQDEYVGQPRDASALQRVSLLVASRAQKLVVAG